MATTQKPPLRFHMMIGPGCSGKSTTARILVRALQTQRKCTIRYISSAGIRRELYEDSSVYGRWAEVEAEIHSQLLQAISAEETVILEASYTRRAFRLAITQALELPVAVQWIGWWLDTPLQLCLEWNRQRTVPLPEGVIKKHCAQLLQAAPVPHRQEGFTQVVRLRPEQGIPLEQLVPAELERLDGCLQRAANRDAAYQLHGYSRLLDLERLLYLIRLLSDHPKLSGTEEPDGSEVEHLLSPLPASGVPERAAALLARLHGACYGNALAVSRDLAWLDQQGYTSRWLGVREDTLPLIEPPPWPRPQQRPEGGLPGERASGTQPQCQRCCKLRIRWRYIWRDAVVSPAGAGSNQRNPHPIRLPAARKQRPTGLQPRYSVAVAVGVANGERAAATAGGTARR